MEKVKPQLENAATEEIQWCVGRIRENLLTLKENPKTSDEGYFLFCHYRYDSQDVSKCYAYFITEEIANEFKQSILLEQLRYIKPKQKSKITKLLNKVNRDGVEVLEFIDESVYPKKEREGDLYLPDGSVLENVRYHLYMPYSVLRDIILQEGGVEVGTALRNTKFNDANSNEGKDAFNTFYKWVRVNKTSKLSASPSLLGTDTFGTDDLDFNTVLKNFEDFVDDTLVGINKTYQQLQKLQELDEVMKQTTEQRDKVIYYVKKLQKIYKVLCD